MSFLDTAKRYDRSVLLVVTALGVLTITYIAAGSRIDAIVRETPVVKQLQQVDAVQAEKNIGFDKGLADVNKKLDSMDTKLTTLLNRR